MTYIQLKQERYLLKTSIGPKEIHPRSFNYTKILALIDSGAGEDEILPLLTTPELKDGVYEGYISPQHNVMYIKHTTTSSSKTYWAGQVVEGLKIDEVKNPTYAGIYPSLESMQEDWPEYFIW